MLIPQDDAISENGRIDFSKQRITPPFPFTLKGILKSIEDHPIKFGASGEENLNDFTFNLEKQEKNRKLALGISLMPSLPISKHIHLLR